MLDKTFGDAGSRIVLEERLSGPEVSFFVVADGDRYVPLLSAQDHKRVFDNDQGPNTGGMGAFAPSPLMTADLQAGHRANDRSPGAGRHGRGRQSVSRLSLLRT